MFLLIKREGEGREGGKGRGEGEGDEVEREGKGKGERGGDKKGSVRKGEEWREKGER